MPLHFNKCSENTCFFFFFQPFKVPVLGVSTFTSAPEPPCLCVRPGQGGGGGVASRHISRRALIGCRVSPDTAVIVFCRGSSRRWYEVCASEWSSTVRFFLCVCVSVFADDDVIKQRDCSSPCCKEQEDEEDPALICLPRSEWTGEELSVWSRLWGRLEINVSSETRVFLFFFQLETVLLVLWSECNCCKRVTVAFPSPSFKVPNAQTRGALLELHLFIKNRN